MQTVAKELETINTTSNLDALSNKKCTNHLLWPLLFLKLPPPLSLTWPVVPGLDAEQEPAPFSIAEAALFLLKPSIFQLVRPKTATKSWSGPTKTQSCFLLTDFSNYWNFTHCQTD